MSALSQTSIAAAMLLATLTCHAEQAAPPSVSDLASMPLDALLDVQVTGASKIAQRMSETAASVTVITAAEIRALGYRTIADVLRSVRGVMLASDRTYDYIGVRGFYAPGDYNTRVLLLVDGNRINDPVYDQAYIGGEFPLDLALVERVEFVPGQGSSVFGANALLGVINVITRRASAGEPTTAGVWLGSAGTREVRGSTRVPLGDGSLLVAASRRLAAGNDLFDGSRVQPGVSDGWARGTDYERRSALYAKYEGGSWSASLIHSDRLKGAPFHYYFDTIHGDPRTNYRDTMTLLNVDTVVPISEITEVTGRVTFGRYAFVGNYAIDYPPPTINRDTALGRWWGVEGRLFTTQWRDHKTVVGVELQRAGELTQRNFDLDAAGTVYLDDHRKSLRAALYAEDQWAVTPRTVVTIGMRHDHIEGKTQAFSPRLALNYRPTDELVFKAIHGSAFRPPNAYEAYYSVDAAQGFKVNSSLVHERIRGSELVAEWRPRADTRWAASVFSTSASDLLVLTYDAVADRYQYQNLGLFRSRGFELEGERTWSGGGRVRASYSWQRNSTEGGATATTPFPSQMAKVALIQPLVAQWTLGVDVQALSRRGSTPGHAVVNAALATQLGERGVGLSVGVRNLFARALFDPGADPIIQPSVPSVGRQWSLAVEFPF